MAEMDGNLTCKKIGDEVVELHWCGKFRGAGFDPVLFQICPITSDRVRDAKGKFIPSVTVRRIDNDKAESIEDELADDQEQLLLLLDTTPGKPQAKIAEALGWAGEFGPNKAKVNRVLASLIALRFTEKNVRGKYRLTDKGKKEAAKLRETT